MTKLERCGGAFILIEVKIGEHFTGIFVSQGRVTLKATGDNLTHWSRNTCVQVRNWHRPLLRPTQETGDGAVGVVGHLAGEQLVANQTDSEEVGARIEFLGLGLLGRHILHGPEEGTRLRHPIPAERAGEAEIHDHNFALRVAHNIAWLQVAMDDPDPVRRVQATQHLPHDVNCFDYGKLAGLSQNLLKALTFYIFHGDKANSAGFSQIENANYISVCHLAGKN